MLRLANALDGFSRCGREGTLDTFALTGRVEIAGSIAALEVISKIAWYYLHERLWSAISWGRRS
jgi:hypothetical protein